MCEVKLEDISEKKDTKLCSVHVTHSNDRIIE
jgi:hypothetical protein